MTEFVKTFLNLKIIIPCGLLIASIVIFTIINKIPLYYKIKIRQNLLEAKIYFLKNKGKNFEKHFNLWFKVIDEALKSDLDEKEIYEFMSDYINSYIFRTHSMDIFDPSVFTKDEIIKISTEFLKNRRSISSK